MYTHQNVCQVCLKYIYRSLPKCTFICVCRLVTNRTANSPHQPTLKNPACLRFLLFTTLMLHYFCFPTAQFCIPLPYFCLFVCLGWFLLSGNYGIIIMSAAAQSRTTTASVCVLPVQWMSALNANLMVQLMKNIWLMKNTPSAASCL